MQNVLEPLKHLRWHPPISPSLIAAICLLLPAQTAGSNFERTLTFTPSADSRTLSEAGQAGDRIEILPAVELVFQTQFRFEHRLLRSTNLVDWEAVAGPFEGTGGKLSSFQRAAPVSRSFYRIQTDPLDWSKPNLFSGTWGVWIKNTNSVWEWRRFSGDLWPDESLSLEFSDYNTGTIWRLDSAGAPMTNRFWFFNNKPVQTQNLSGIYLQLDGGGGIGEPYSYYFETPTTVSIGGEKGIYRYADRVLTIEVGLTTTHLGFSEWNISNGFAGIDVSILGHLLMVGTTRFLFY